MDGLEERGELRIRVHDRWDGWRTAEIRLKDIQEVHWFQPNGAPRPFLHGFVLCSDVVNGNLLHECRDDSRPHRLHVCILKSHAVTSAFVQLSRTAAEHDAHERAALHL